MNDKCSYDIHTIAAASEPEVRRLGAQVDLFWEKESRIYLQRGLGQAQTLLDCGCGTGHFVNRLASMFPALNITAIDIDPYLLKIAEETTKAHREQISILAGSICSIPLPENSFDLVISRLVLEHLPDPLAAHEGGTRPSRGPPGLGEMADPARAVGLLRGHPPPARR